MSQTDAEVGKHVHGEAGAVKTAGAGAAVGVGRAQILHGEGDDITAGTAADDGVSAAFGGAVLGRGVLRGGGGLIGGLDRHLRCGRFFLHGQIQIVASDIAGLVAALNGEVAILQTGDLHAVTVLQGSQHFAAPVGLLQQRHFLGVNHAVGLKSFVILQKLDILRGNKAGAVVIADPKPIAQILHHGHDSVQRKQDVDVALLGGVKEKGNVLFQHTAHGLDLCFAGQQAGKLRLLAVGLQTGCQRGLDDSGVLRGGCVGRGRPRADDGIT